MADQPAPRALVLLAAIDAAQEARAAEVIPIERKHDAILGPLRAELHAFEKKARTIVETCGERVPRARQHHRNWSRLGNVRIVALRGVRVETFTYCGEGNYEPDHPITFPIHWLDAEPDTWVAELNAFYDAREAETAKQKAQMEAEREANTALAKRALFEKLKAEFEPLHARRHTMSLYHIAWAIGARQGHGEWFGTTDLPFLHRTIGVLNARHGPGTHRIEERVVTRAAQMMAEALLAGEETP